MGVSERVCEVGIPIHRHGGFPFNEERGWLPAKVSTNLLIAQTVRDGQKSTGRRLWPVHVDTELRP